MDRLEALGNSLSQITLYDIKSMYNQAKNVVLNVSEIEAKVQEATNDDPWGASSTLMQEIANRTFNYPDFNEIMPAIYSRFMEKEARQWRQIYKALQLLEYIIKHGSERVVDDARSHISTIKMLRNFHYIDDKGKDQGLNVRNRAKEIVELLADVDKIRAERRKAKANKHKYTGTGNEALSFSSSGGRYGGFGSDSYYSGGGGGGGGNDYGSSGIGSSSWGGSSNSFRDDNRRGYEEYNAGDDEISTPRRSDSISTPARQNSTSTKATPGPPPAKAPEVDLIGGFDDADFGAPSVTNDIGALGGLATNKALPAVQSPPKQPVVSIDDDDFADFQAAPVQTGTTTSAVPPAAAGVDRLSLVEMLMTSPPTYNTIASQPAAKVGMNATPAMGAGVFPGAGHRPTGSLSGSSQFSSPPLQPQGLTPGLFGAAPLAASPPPANVIQPMRPFGATASGITSPPTTNAKPAAGGNFDDLWSMSLGSGSKPTTGTGAGKSMKDLEKEKANAGLWGAGGGGGSQAGAFGAFGSMVGSKSSNNTNTSTTSGGIDDLLF